MNVSNHNVATAYELLINNDVTADEYIEVGSCVRRRIDRFEDIGKELNKDYKDIEEVLFEDTFYRLCIVMNNEAVQV